MNQPPVIERISPAPSVAQALRCLACRESPILFDSARQHRKLGRYTFLSAEPSETFRIEQPDALSDPFSTITQRMSEFPAVSVPGLPPFQGGAAGLLCYELARCFEKLPVPASDPFRLPAAVIGLYDWVLAWDHDQGDCWLISTGYPETVPALRAVRAREQFRSVMNCLQREPESAPPSRSVASARLDTTLETFPFEGASPGRGLVSNFDRDEYLRAVKQVIEYIHAGDIFQANLSQRLACPAKLPPVEQYLKLRATNPAPFGGFLAHEDWAVLSSSPERFLQLEQGELSTRPIKGTRQRRVIPEADLFTQDELRESEKDRAENVMIVDLLRNDLSRVCLPGTVRVPELCQVEVYETVSHLVSEVRGQLRAGLTFFDALRATFPGGSITGAPKIRAMEIITEMERAARGAYCGSLFYSGFDGTSDSSILIRTMTQRHGWLTFPAGGGIVAPSDPREEYEETLHKARGMLRALE